MNLALLFLPPATVLMSEHRTSIDVELDVTLLGTHHVRKLQRRHHQQSELTTNASGFTVTWSANRHQALEPGHQHDRVLPVVGHAYAVHRTDVTRLDGPATEAELAIVRQVAVPDQLAAIRAMLPDQLVLGETVTAGPLFAGILDEAPGDPRVVSGDLTLTSVENGTATWAMVLHLQSRGTDDKGTQIQTDARGTGWLGVQVATGRTTRLELAGDLHVAASRADLSTTGSGRFSTRTTLGYALP
jgi:hypothetical protein